MKNQNYKINFSSIMILIFGLFFGSALGGGLIALSEFTGFDSIFQILAYAVSMLSPILFFDFFVARKGGNKLGFDFSSKPFRIYLIIFLMTFGMILIGDVITQMIPTTGIFAKLYESYELTMNGLSTNTVSLILMTVILAPILEEILFRGILLKGMINNKMNPKIAILVSAFVFGAIHVYPWQFAGAFLLGLVFGLVYYKTKSLLIPILLHAFNNLLSVLFVLYSDSESFSEFFGVKNGYVFLLGIMIFSVSFYFFIKKYNTKSIR